MVITYEPRYNIAYIRLQEKLAKVETLKISDELKVDMAPDDKVCGIELLNVKAQQFSEDQGKLVVINEALGGIQEINLI